MVHGKTRFTKYNDIEQMITDREACTTNITCNDAYTKLRYYMESFFYFVWSYKIRTVSYECMFIWSILFL